VLNHFHCKVNLMLFFMSDSSYIFPLTIIGLSFMFTSLRVESRPPTLFPSDMSISYSSRTAMTTSFSPMPFKAHTFQHCNHPRHSRSGGYFQTLVFALTNNLVYAHNI
jgi:hypothetical protein